MDTDGAIQVIAPQRRGAVDDNDDMHAAPGHQPRLPWNIYEIRDVHMLT